MTLSLLQPAYLQSAYSADQSQAEDEHNSEQSAGEKPVPTRKRWSWRIVPASTTKSDKDAKTERNERDDSEETEKSASKAKNEKKSERDKKTKSDKSLTDGAPSSSADSTTDLEKQVENGKAAQAIEAKIVSASTQLVVTPFMVLGHRCTAIVIDAIGRPVENAGVYVDNELLCSNSKGLVTFTVPDTETFELSLLGDEHRKIAKRKFLRSPDKIFAENDKLAEMAVGIERIEDSGTSDPIIVYAPAVLSPKEIFVIAGHNFSEKISDNLLDIDGINARIIAASPEVIVAQAPSKLSLGQSRELILTANGQASNAAEVDIATPFFTHTKIESDDVSPEKGRMGMNGTNVPCLIKVKNLDTDNVSLWSPEQEPLGKSNMMLSPGGEQNYLNVDVRLLNDADPKVDLSLQQEIAATGDITQVPAQLLSALCRAEIMRIERRRISANYRLDELKRQEVKAQSDEKASSADSGAGETSSANTDKHSTDGSIKNSDESQKGSKKLAREGEGKSVDSDKQSKQLNENERNTAERKSLSNRLRRVSIMLAARKAIFESLGNTDAQFRQVLDDAAGGALFTLDQSVKPIQILSAGGVGGLANLPNRAPNSKHGRPLRMLEPPIHLLLPMTSSERAIMQSRDAGSNSDTGASVPAPNTSDEPSLRPSMPEPEPEVSETSRFVKGSKGPGSESAAKKAESKASEKAGKKTEKQPEAKAHKGTKTNGSESKQSKGKIKKKATSEEDNESSTPSRRHRRKHKTNTVESTQISHHRHGKSSSNPPSTGRKGHHRRHH